MRNVLGIGSFLCWSLHSYTAQNFHVVASQAEAGNVLVEAGEGRLSSGPQAVHIGEQSYSLEERRAPLVSLRVVDRSGNVSEVPIDFREAQRDTRGFWGDVAVNGSALFLASVPFLILREFITWVRAKRQRARAEARRELAAKRRAAISAELSAADQELRELQAKKTEKDVEEVGPSVVRLVTLLDSYREELKGYEAPALMAYLESLVAQASQFLRSQRRMDTGEEPTGGLTGVLLESSEGVGALVQPSVEHRSETTVVTDVSSADSAVLQARRPSTSANRHLSLVHALDNLDSDKSTETESEVPSSAKQRSVAAKRENTQAQGKPFKVAKPDLSLVQRVMSENPGMSPAEVIRRATELQIELTKKVLQYSP